MIKEYEKLLEKGRNDFKANKKFLHNLKSKRPRDLDAIIARIHDEIFKDIDCLDCANCCITTGALILDADIVRIAKNIRMKNNKFIDKYVEIDEDEDYVFNELPCPFLRDDNYCSIYEVRPKACREYPHTNQRKFYNRLHITEKNTLICPAIVLIVDKLKEELNS